MEKNSIDEVTKLVDNINIGIIVFSAEKDGMVEFKPLWNVTAIDKCISFSVLLTIEYNEPIKQSLELNLIKLDSDKPDIFDSLLLESLAFNEKHSISSSKGKLRCNNLLNMPSIDFKDYNFKHSMRYSFNNVPLLGDGIYFVSLGVVDDNSFLPLKSIPINVVFFDDNNMIYK